MIFDSAISAAQDIASRAQLQKLRDRTLPLQENAENSYESSRFRVHGWRWHHLGIIRDLTRLHGQCRQKKRRLCEIGNTKAPASRQQLLAALRYIIDDNWALHNTVEANVFLPWVATRARADDTQAIIARERERLARESRMLTSRVDAWVQADRGGQTCEREVDAIAGGLDRLRRNAAALFDASEDVLVPMVMRLFSEKEQLRFNSTVLKRITGRQARVSLVIFRDAVDLRDPVVATPEDLEDFEQSVPAAVRRLALPYWRNKFVDERIRFITDVD